MEVVGWITKAKDISYEEYLQRVKKNSFVQHVKIADLQNNIDISHISKPSEKDYQRIEKNKKALEILENKKYNANNYIRCENWAISSFYHKRGTGIINSQKYSTSQK